MKPSRFNYVAPQAREIEDPLWWRRLRWLLFGLVLLHPLYLPGLLWPFAWALLGIQLVALFRLNESPFRAWAWLALRLRGVDPVREYEPGWYGYKGRTLRGTIDETGTLWFPLDDLELPAPATRTLAERYRPDEIRRAGFTTWLSLKGLQRCLAEYPTYEMRAMQRWLETIVIPSHQRHLDE